MKAQLLVCAGAALLAGGAAGERFHFPNFQNRPHLNLNGDAVADVGQLVLTKAAKNQVGAVWFDKRVDVEDGFTATFSFSVTEVENSGGEGFAFVLQQSGPYAIGGSKNGLGYDGLDGGIAVEFDAVPDEALNDRTVAHVSVHSALYSGKPLSTQETEPEQWSADLPELVTYDTEQTATKHRFITVKYAPARGVISVSESHRNSKNFESRELIKEAAVGAIRGEFYVGFTAATGDSFARYAITSWYMSAQPRGVTAAQACSEGFTGADCAVTNEMAATECPRRLACNVCVEDVYNCAWCASSGSKGSCVVGTSENLGECKTVSLEPLSCAASLSHVWLYLLLLAGVVILAFGLVLFKTLPVRQSFKAISILVALMGGGFFGMIISYVISASLVEISETAFFGMAYGLFFLVQFILIGAHIAKVEVPNRGFCDAHVVLLMVCNGCILLSAIACLVLDKRLIHWLPEGPKVLFYTVLGGTLNFCLVFSIGELAGELATRCAEPERYGANIASSLESGKSARQSIAQSQARMALLAAGSILSGLFFGFMFGTLRIEEESKYRMALALQQEAAYTYPVGALLGGVSAMLYQLIQLPLASDEDIDRILRHHAGDDL